MRIATWNINSVRLRINHVLRFVKEQNIDIICMQETKTEDQYFPINGTWSEGFSQSLISLQLKYDCKLVSKSLETII